MVGHAPTGAAAESVSARCVLTLCEGASGVETPSGECEFTVESGMIVLYRIHLDHSAHLSAVLGRNSSCIDTQRLDIIRLNLRPKTRRSVVGQGNTVDDELRLIFRAARMQHSVSFI